MNHQVKDAEEQKWIHDIADCLGKITKEVISLNDIYVFVPELAAKHPDNHHVKEKIREQLQILRDKGVIEFLGHGIYKKLAPLGSFFADDLGEL